MALTGLSSSRAGTIPRLGKRQNSTKSGTTTIVMVAS